jgi:hypothetical protein
LDTLDSNLARELCAGKIKLVADVDTYQTNRVDTSPTFHWRERLTIFTPRDLSTTIHEEASADLKSLQMERAGYLRAAQSELAADLAAYHVKPAIDVRAHQTHRVWRPQPTKIHAFLQKAILQCKLIF